MAKPKPNYTYQACDGWEFGWTQMEVFAVKKLYKNSAKLVQIAEEVNRPAKEVFMLLIDLIETGQLEEGQKLFRMVG